ncbi:MAG: ADP-forming succinate--CoA ligase subunit beta [Gammaproteobacteria bacterium]|nr:ADP-forming succinate--CoA ligase subunit beta [Gammaproteobacteria bacterium]
MNLHEYQAKQLLAEFGLPVSQGRVVNSVEEAAKVAGEMGLSRFVVKAQVHAGGRGKAGGVKLVDNKQAVQDFVAKHLGTHLVTYQTTATGQPVNQILIEAPCEIAQELYLGAVIDRSKQRIVFMASTEGGVEIEKVAEESPNKILTTAMDLIVGMMPYQGRELGFALGMKGQLLKDFVQLLLGLGKLFVNCDLSMLEINPLVITKDGKLLCLDAKINIDDNALYRQPKLAALRDASQEDEREHHAREWELNYIALDGDIGCMVNGAGLAMATMDMIKLHGGNPANFLDVGGGATKERVTEAFKIILSDPKVKAILINIFGGIVRCDLIAEGIIGAIAEIGTDLPVVVRLEGNNADLGLKLLTESGLNIIAASSFTDAAKKVVASAKTRVNS